MNNDRLIRALLRQPVDRTPVWMMRQAGRYLPEYREVRKQAGDFLSLCQNPELACEVTLQPLHRFPLDAAILFSDILTIPDAMGLGLYFVEGEGPKFRHPLRDEQALRSQSAPDPEQSLGYVMDAVRLIRRELNGDVPLIGFSGSPWTLACYMIEGGASKNFSIIKQMAYDLPEALDALLDVLSQAVADYLNAQIAAGVQVVQIFDTWGGVLSTPAFERFSLLPMKRIIDRLDRQSGDQTVPVIAFTKGGGGWLERLADSGADALGLDWTQDIGLARTRVGDRVALQGNLDPSILNASPAVIESEVQRILKDFGQGSGHVFNLGHGIHPNIPPEHAAAMIDAVHKHSVGYHSALSVN